MFVPVCGRKVIGSLTIQATFRGYQQQDLNTLQAQTIAAERSNGGAVEELRRLEAQHAIPKDGSRRPVVAGRLTFQ